jgi:hypothetical protein
LWLWLFGVVVVASLYLINKEMNCLF